MIKFLMKLFDKRSNKRSNVQKELDTLYSFYEGDATHWMSIENDELIWEFFPEDQ